MNPDVFQFLKDNDNKDKIIETPCGIPIFEGDEADKRYIKYFTEGLNDVDILRMKGRL